MRFDSSTERRSDRRGQAPGKTRARRITGLRTATGYRAACVRSRSRTGLRARRHSSWMPGKPGGRCSPATPSRGRFRARTGGCRCNCTGTRRRKHSRRAFAGSWTNPSRLSSTGTVRRCGTIPAARWPNSWPGASWRTRMTRRRRCRHGGPLGSTHRAPGSSGANVGKVVRPKPGHESSGAAAVAVIGAR